jgi:hypothetical protein
MAEMILSRPPKGASRGLWALRELVATFEDWRQCGDLVGHLQIWWLVIRSPELVIERPAPRPAAATREGRRHG